MASERDSSPVFGAQEARVGCSLTVEQLDDRLRKARELVKRVNERFSYGDPRFIDRYREGTCNIGLRRAFGDAREHGLIIGAYPAGLDRFNIWAGHSEKSG